MKRTLMVEFDSSANFAFTTIVKDAEKEFPVWYGATSAEAVGKACLYLDGILDSAGNPEYIGDIEYAEEIIGEFKNH